MEVASSTFETREAKEFLPSPTFRCYWWTSFAFFLGLIAALRADAERFGVADRVEITGFVPDEAMDAELRRCDVCLCLRWPTTRETSASWLRC